MRLQPPGAPITRIFTSWPAFPIDRTKSFKKNTADPNSRRYLMTKTMRRFNFALSFLIVLACGGPWGFAQDNPTATTVYTLEPGEKILNPESTIAFSADEADVVLALAKSEEQNPPYFVFRDGKKTGPYAKIGDALRAAYEGRENTQGRQYECAAYDPGEPPDSARPEMDSAAGSKQVVRFKGKTFGPYIMVFSARATPDGATAFYTAGDNDKAWFGCSDGRVVSFGGIPGEFKFSPDGKNGAVMVEGKLTLAEMNNLTKLPPDKLAAAMNDQEKKFLHTIDGRSFGPFGSSFEASSFWYAKSSNDLFYRVGDDVFRNGARWFKAGSFDRCRFYPGPDGRTYAMSTYENIVFSDGKSFPSPLDVIAFERGGKTIYRWIALEDDKKIVVYERTM